MEEVRKIKTIISRINRKCDKESISLSDALNNLGITILNYLEIIGLDVNLLSDDILKEIEDLFMLPDTRIVVSPNMEDLENDEIEIVSKSSKTTVHFKTNKISVNSFARKEDEEFIYEEENTSILKNKEKIKYTLQVTINKNDLKTRIISEKYPLSHMNIKVTYMKENISKNFEFTINHDMLKSDLNYIIRLLSNFKFVEAFAILNRYPASIKIIGKNNELV